MAATKSNGAGAGAPRRTNHVGVLRRRYPHDRSSTRTISGTSGKSDHSSVPRRSHGKPALPMRTSSPARWWLRRDKDALPVRAGSMQIGLRRLEPRLRTRGSRRGVAAATWWHDRKGMHPALGEVKPRHRDVPHAVILRHRSAPRPRLTMLQAHRALCPLRARGRKQPGPSPSRAVNRAGLPRVRPARPDRLLIHCHRTR